METRYPSMHLTYLSAGEIEPRHGVLCPESLEAGYRTLCRHVEKETSVDQHLALARQSETEVASLLSIHACRRLLLVCRNRRITAVPLLHMGHRF